MIQFLSLELVIDLYEMLIDTFGGLRCIRDKNLLESALAYPQLQHSIGMEHDIYILAASYAYHLIKNHPFLDGNKRIGILAMLTFLRINGEQFFCSQNDLYNLAMHIATSQVDEHEIATILKAIHITNKN